MPGANPCKAVRLEAQDGVAWAARLDHPDKEVPQRKWRTEVFVVRQQGELTKFGAQTTCISGEYSAPLYPSRPGVVRQILGNLSAQADGWELNDRVHFIDSERMDEFIDLITYSGRNLPIVAISMDEFGHTLVSPEYIAARVSGAAHLVTLDFDRCRDLTRAVGKEFSVFNGAIRVYMPGFDEENDNRYTHPLWLRRELDSDDLILNEVSRRVFGSTLSMQAPHAFISVPQLESLQRRQERKKNSSNDEVDIIKQELEEVRKNLESVKEEYEAAWALAQETQHELSVARNDFEAKKDENQKLKNENYMLRSLQYSQPQDEQADVMPERVEDFDEWIEENLLDKVVFSKKALKDWRKNGNIDILERVAKTLIAMRKYKIPYLSGEGEHFKEKWEEECGALGVKDSPCFSRRDEAKNRDEYNAILPDKRSFVLEDHLKYGNGTDTRHMFRIYYAWDKEAGQIAIGWLPTHLPNNLTN